MAHPYLITKRSGNTPNSSVIAQLDMRREEKLQNVTIDTGYQAGGISSVYVCRTGKNLMPRFSSYSGNGITITANTDGSLTVGGQATGTILIYSGGVSGLPDIHYRVLGGQYTISGTSDAITGTYHMCSTIRKRADWSFVETIALNGSVTQQTFQIADPNDVDNVYLRLYSGAGPTGQSAVLYPQLELGSAKTAYEPYRGDIYTVTLPETIYGGLIDLTNGKATSLYASDGTLLAEPVVYDITPQDITAFQGINNIWSDYGTVAVRYWSAPGEQMHPASASGSLVTIANGADARMISCMADIDAVQDLHGYSNPWPAGGGKNLLDESEMYVGYYSPTDLHFVANDAYRTAIIDELPAGTYTFSTSLSNPYLLRAFYDGTNHSATSASSSLTFTSTTSGKVMVCFRNTDTSDITETFHTQIEKGSPATSWEPYSNICPVTGWTGVNVYRTGKNLINKADGKITSLRYMAFGVDAFSDTYPNGKLVLPAGNYILSLSGDNSTNAETLAVYDASGNRIKIAYNNKVMSFTVNETTALKIVIIISSGSFVSWDNYDIQLESGSAATAYEPYTGSVYPVEFPAFGKNLSPISAHSGNPRYFWGTDYSAMITVLNTLPVGTYTISNKYKVVSMPDSGAVTHGRFYITALVNGTQTGLLSYSVVTDDAPTVGKVYQESGTFTISEDAKGNINHVYMYCDDSTTHTGSERGSYDLYDIQIEAGSSATSYEPYTNTVYGGSIDLVSGVLTVTHKIVDLSQISWALRDTGLYRSGVISDMVAVSSNSERVDGYADHYPVASYTSLSSGEYGIGVNTQRRIFIGGGSEGAGSFVYPLATPQTHQLTPQEVRTIAGLNHIWADTGNAAVRYWRN